MKVLVVTYGGGHVQALLPVVQKLRRRADFEVTVLGLTTAQPVLSEAGIPFLGFQDVIPDSMKKDAMRFGKELSLGISANPLISEKETQFYLGANFLELCLEHGEATARDIYKSRGRQAFLPLRVMDHLFERLQPDLLICTNSPRSEQASVLTARKRGVPCVCIVDLYNPSEIEDRTGHTGYADRLCVLHDFVKRALLSAGRSEREVIVTGNPAFDKLAPYLDRKPPRADGSRRVLFARSFTPQEREMVEETQRELFRIFSQKPNWHLVIRPHPSESVPPRLEIPNSSISTSNESLPEVISSCDVLMTRGSTVALEAAIMGKPVLTLDYPGTFANPLYRALGISTSLQSKDELESAIESAFALEKNPAGKSFSPGIAAANVIQVGDELLSVTRCSG